MMVTHASRMGGWLHGRAERKLRRACYIPGELVSVQGWHGQCPAAKVESCTRFADVQNFAGTVQLLELIIYEG